MTLLQPIGAVLGLWGIVWLMLDTRSTAPGYLMVIGLVAIIAGGALT